MPWFIPAIPAVISGLSTAGGIAAGASATGTFLGLSATAWGGIGLAAGLAGTGMQIVGQRQQAQGQEQAAKYNQRATEVQAVDAERRGSMAQSEANARTRAVLGSVHARQGASGVIAGDGTGLDVLSDVAEVGARDSAAIHANAAREAWGIRAQSAIDYSQASNAAAATRARAVGTFGQGVNTFAKDPWWKRFQSDDLQSDSSTLVSGMGY